LQYKHYENHLYTHIHTNSFDQTSKHCKNNLHTNIKLTSFQIISTTQHNLQFQTTKNQIYKHNTISTWSTNIMKTTYIHIHTQIQLAK